MRRLSIHRGDSSLPVPGLNVTTAPPDAGTIPTRLSSLSLRVKTTLVPA